MVKVYRALTHLYLEAFAIYLKWDGRQGREARANRMKATQPTIRPTHLNFILRWRLCFLSPSALC